MKQLAVFIILPLMCLATQAHQLGQLIEGGETKTASTDTSLVLKPDGAGGVIWGAAASPTSGVTAAQASNIAEAVVSESLESSDTNSAASKQYVLDNAGGVSTLQLAGPSALDWGVLNGTMGRMTSNGYSTIYGDHDTFRYTDSLPLYSASGGTVTTNYIGLWRDANATVQIIQQVSGDNGSTWDAVTNDIAATTNATIFGIGSIDLNAGANLYRVAIETNAISGTIYIYQIDARGQL